MSLYQIELRNDGSSSKSAAFRVWIDPVQRDLDLEIEIPLQKVGDCWRGSFLMPSRGTGFYYRVGAVGDVGSWWWLQIRDVYREVRVIRDEDRLTMPKVWILGSCGVLSQEPASESDLVRCPAFPLGT